MAEIDLYAVVKQTTDVRDDAAGNHDMGNVHPGERLHLVEKYNKNGQLWFRADNLERFVQPGYNETWVNGKDIGFEAEPPPLPPGDYAPSAEDLFAARRVIAFLLGK
jgi:hypothetical protein